jgi:ElaB/YqjD/DUF883 family membrane-anchored ribosome-binding protein
METGNWNKEREQTAAGSQCSDTSCACGNIKHKISDKLHKAAEAVGKRAARQDAQPAMAKYGKQAAEILDQSAESIEQIDYQQVDAKVREYVRRNPGASLLIAGVTGLVVGAIFRRR